LKIQRSLEAIRKVGAGHAERNFAFWRGVE
jgi:hypothetical protein